MLNQSAESAARLQRLIVVSVIGVVLGFLIVIQLRSQAVVARTLASQDDTSIALLINDLNHANNQLLQQSTVLQQQQAQLQHALTTGGADAQTINKELMTLQVINGVIPVHGPGLVIRIQGTVMDFELQDLLNSLRQATGEACAVSGYRVVAGTSIVSKGNTLTIDNHDVPSPLVINVIGDPDQLGPAADQAVSSLQTRMQVEMQPRSDVAITEVVTPHPLIYAQTGH